jgi:hypothetical protein
MRFLVSIVCGLTVLGSQQAQALSIVASKPHDSHLACVNVQSILDQIWEGDKQSKLLHTLFFTDKSGLVEYGELPDFIAAMRTSEGKMDREKPRVAKLVRLTKEKFSPLYVAAIERSMWHESRSEDDGMGGEIAVPDPRFYDETSYWLVDFNSNHVQRMREALELYSIATTERSEVLSCT